MNYKLDKQIVHNDVLRNSFIDLAIKTFDLSFKEWYRKGYWTDAYIPYALVSNNKVIANASANIIDLVWQDEPRRYIQIGTVMTDVDHSNKGLAGRIKPMLSFCSLTQTPLIFIQNSASSAPRSIRLSCR